MQPYKSTMVVHYKSTMVVHGSLEGGRGWGTHRGGPKAPIGATDPVLNIVHRHQVTAPTGAFAMATRRHPVAASPNVIACKMGTG